MPEFPTPRNRVESPLELSGHSIECPDRPGRGTIGLVHAAAENEQVLVHRSRRCHLQRSRSGVDAQILAQVNVATASEGPDQFPRPRIDGVGPVADKVEDPFALGPLPVRDPSVALPDDRAAVMHRGIEDPDALPGCGVQRHGVEAWRDGVENPIDDQRVRVHRRTLGGVPCPILPGGLEAVHVRRVDLGQRRVLPPGLVPEVYRPIPIADGPHRLAEITLNLGGLCCRGYSDDGERSEAQRPNHRSPRQDHVAGGIGRRSRN